MSHKETNWRAWFLKCKLGLFHLSAVWYDREEMLIQCPRCGTINYHPAAWGV